MATAPSRHHDRRISPVFLGIVAVMAVSGWAVWTSYAASRGLAVFLFVTAAWVVSLCLHEYAHARTALHGGDITVGAKGYLTLNPLKYTHALLVDRAAGDLRDHGRHRPARRRGLHRARPHPGPLAAQPDLGGGPAHQRPVRDRVHRPVLAARAGRGAAATSASRWRSSRCSR